MLEIYQHLPEHISPIAISVGFLNIRWYSLMYLMAFGVVYWLLRYRVWDKRDQSSAFPFPDKSENSSKPSFYNNLKLKIIDEFILYSVVGLLIGARLGYVFFYNFSYFWKNPIQIISPYDFTSGIYTGISGMSYFGGLIGILISSIIFIKYRFRLRGRNEIERVFWQWVDFVIPAIPAGYFFGRIGNFLNGELYGRATAKFWGMYFSGGGMLRHPSQLYEAFWEGIILFIILWTLRDRAKFPGQLLAIYLFGYGFFRFFIEFFREPDPQIGLIAGFLTLGQIFSLGLIISSLVLYFWQKSKKMVKL